ncbi:hypothetical protein ABFY53_00615 [Serratia nematodiphila]
MTQAAEMGAVIMPPVPAFYHQPKSMEDIIDSDRQSGESISLISNCRPICSPVGRVLINIFIPKLVHLCNTALN